MKIIQNISEDEMIAIFLKGEISSVRFGNGISEILEKTILSKHIIENPDTTNAAENQCRKEVFRAYRGYGENTRLFEGFPSDVQWKKVLLAKEDIQNAKYINYDYWVELSSGTRRVKDGASNVLGGKEVFRQSNEGFLKAAESFKDGKTFNQLILVATNEHSDLILLEGHLRATAYCMAPEYIPKELEAVVGFSEDIANWGLY